jgi:hypothetical protein
MTELLLPHERFDLAVGFLSALAKFAAPVFKPLAKLDAEVKKDCHTCSEPDKYKPAKEASALGGAAVRALAEELLALGAVTEKQAEAVFEAAPAQPVSRPISEGEAEYSLQRLKRLEQGRPTADQLARGAAVGAAVGPIASLAFRTIAGKSVRAPTDQQFLPRVRQLAAQAGHGAIFGGAMPAVTNKLEREAEKSKLRTFLGQQEPPQQKVLGQLNGGFDA